MHGRKRPSRFLPPLEPANEHWLAQRAQFRLTELLEPHHVWEESR